MKNLHRYISSLKMVFLVPLLSAESVYGNPLQNAPQEKELVTHEELMELDIARRSLKDRQMMWVTPCNEDWENGTGECEEVVQCYEQCYPGCSRMLYALERCHWQRQWKGYNPETVEWKCTKKCGKEAGIKCTPGQYKNCRHWIFGKGEKTWRPVAWIRLRLHGCLREKSWDGKQQNQQQQKAKQDQRWVNWDWEKRPRSCAESARGSSVHGMRPCPCVESAWSASVTNSFKQRRAKDSNIRGHENSRFMRYWMVSNGKAYHELFF